MGYKGSAWPYTCLGAGDQVPSDMCHQPGVSIWNGANVLSSKACEKMPNSPASYTTYSGTE